MPQSLFDLYDEAETPQSMVRPGRPLDPLAGRGAASAFARSAGRSTLPTVGGVAAFPAGAAAGGIAVAPIAALSGPAAPIVEGVGTIAGGLATSFGAGWAIEKAQDWALARLPDSVTSAIGMDPASREADELYHPRASFLGGLAPQVAFMRPSMSLHLAGRAAGAAIGGGVEAGTEYAQDGKVDWLRVGAQAAGGALLDKETWAGRKAMAPARWAVDRIPTGAGVTQAAQGARDTIRAGAGAAADVAAGARETVLAKLFPLTPEPIRRRWLAAGTMDGAIESEQLREIHGDEHLTPDEQAAIAVAGDDALTRGTSAFAANADGDRAHGERLSATMQSILAGQTLPDFGPPAGSLSTRANLQSGIAAAGLGAPDVIATAKAGIAAHESGGDYAARNPLPGQSASGKYQFIDKTWRGIGRQLMPGASDAQIMAAKSDPATQERFMDHALAGYSRALRQAGAPATPGNLYLLHFLGPDGLKILRADASTPVAALLGDRAIAANRKWLAGKSAGQLVLDMAKRAGGDVRLPEPVAAAYEPVERGFDPMPFLDPMRDYVVNTRKPLTPEAIAEHLGLDDADQGAKVISAVARAGDIPASIGASGALRRLPTRSGPVDAATFLADRGGVRDDEGHDLKGGRDLQQMVAGAGPLIRQSGMSVDAAGEALWQAGYFGPPETTDRPDGDAVLQFLEELRHRKAYTPEEHVDAIDAQRARDGYDIDEIQGHLHSLGSELGLDLDQADLDRAGQLVMDGTPPAQALRAIVGEQFDAAQLAGGAETDEPYQSWDDDDALSGNGDAWWPAADDPAYGDAVEASERDRGNQGEGDTDGGQFEGAERGDDPRSDAVSLAEFDDYIGEGARAQADSVEHDLLMDATGEATVHIERADLHRASVEQLRALAEKGPLERDVDEDVVSREEAREVLREHQDYASWFTDGKSTPESVERNLIDIVRRTLIEQRDGRWLERVREGTAHTDQIAAFVRLEGAMSALRQHGTDLAALPDRLLASYVDHTGSAADAAEVLGARLEALKRSATPRLDNATPHGPQPDIDTLIEAQRGKPIEQLHEAATRNQAELGEMARAIAAETGAEFKDPGVKALARVREKIATEFYDDPGELKDLARGAFVVDDVAQADAIVTAIGTRAGFVDKGWQQLDSGYLDRKLIVRFADGHVGEVQIVPRPIWEAKKGGLGKLYREGRSTPDPARKAATDARQREGYAAALESSGWASASSAEKSTFGKAASASSRDSLTPSDDDLLTRPGASPQRPLDQAHAARTDAEAQTRPTARSSTSNNSSDVMGKPSTGDIVDLETNDNATAFRADDEGQERSINDLLAEADEEDAGAAALRGCLAPRIGDGQ